MEGGADIITKKGEVAVKWIALALMTVSALAGPDCGGCARSCGGQQVAKLNTKLLSLSGDTVDLAEEIKKGPRVLFTFAPDSLGKEVVLALQQAARESGDTAVTLLGVVCGPRQKAVEMKEELGLDFPLVLDQGCVGSAVLELAVCPGATFVDRQGQVVGRAYLFLPEVLAQGFAAIRGAQKQTDPVCGKQVAPQTAVGRYKYKGKTYYFCSKACRAAFAKHPEKYLKQ